MAKKSVLEKELKKRISIGLILLFILFTAFGFGLGYAYKYLTPKEDYSVELIGNEIIVIEKANDYKENSIKVYKNGEEIKDVNVKINGQVKDDIGTYYLNYTILGIDKLEDVVLKRVVIVKGTTSDEVSEDSVKVE